MCLQSWESSPFGDEPSIFLGAHTSQPLGHPLASVLPSSPHPPPLGLCRLRWNKKRAPAGRTECGALSTAGGGGTHPPSEPSKRGVVGGGPLGASPRGCRQEAARPLIGEHTPTPPGTGLSCGNGDSTCLQVHERLRASANPLPKCDAGSAHREQTAKTTVLRWQHGPCEFPGPTPEPPLGLARTQSPESNSLAAAKEHCPLPSWRRERMAHPSVLRSPRSQLLHRTAFPSLPQHPRVQPQPKSLVLVSQELLKGVFPQSVLGISSLGPCGAGRWGKCAPR